MNEGRERERGARERVCRRNNLAREEARKEEERQRGKGEGERRDAY